METLDNSMSPGRSLARSMVVARSWIARSPWGFLFCAWATPVLAQGQAPSLVELARQETDRRAAITTTSRLYTNDDLNGGPRLTIGTVPTDASLPPELIDAPLSAGQPETTVEELGQDYWRNRVTTARDEKRRAEVTATALQSRVDSLWTEFSARDDPFQRASIEQDRDEAIRLLETTQTEIQRLDDEIRDIQEEARRANVPPGWLR